MYVDHRGDAIKFICNNAKAKNQEGNTNSLRIGRDNAYIPSVIVTGAFQAGKS